VSCLAPMGEAVAQPGAPFERPGDERPELPDLERPPEDPELELPPLPERSRERLSAGPRIVLREIRVTGVTAFSEDELRRVTERYVGRPVSAHELQQLGDELTLLYVDAGYVNSGAVLPDQEITDGVVEYRVVEGALEEIQISGNRWFRERWLRARLERGASVPLRVADLEQQLQILQQDARIRRVRAELLPGARRGDAILRVDVEEERPYRAWLEFSNHEPPSVGALGASVRLAHDNLTGWGDRLEIEAAFTEGYRDYTGRYEIPVNRWDTTVRAFYDYGESDVVEEPFDAFDIEAEWQSFGVGVLQPLRRTSRERLDAWLDVEHRRSESFLLGEPFSFGDLAPSERGRAEINVIRLGAEWTYRDLAQALALRSQASVGVDVFGATSSDSSSAPDGSFVAWLGQILWARRFERWGLELIARADCQLANDPLLSLEQFSIGGRYTVRGYRENQLVRDNGVLASVELRVPLWRGAGGRDYVQLAPFADFGHGWQTDREELGPSTLASVGVGVRAAFTDHVYGAFYWGHRLRDVPEPADHDLQDDGVSFELVLAY
jgi:hemolysin activation/secretion protein